ncbi:MAG: hypothetical protein A3G29_02545 [Burkholderiales bacterium RIFCSPLOWO2_12_FULL_64_99]|uniref:porin n=1 Tax=Aquabacterium sp. TaxID=1872578 RepID=UPI0008D4C85B|nr:porin [Aquabacterium sp.]OGB02779.1 MAG: hypothetical protein A3E52_10505 [Burkholderiales bacterium RIFCSPHIGHO2_12_FULL_63_20]OGB64382.1 MAG: hypothetical protein A3G29_02545 [Burkholderiales bacterium RIFCSPLOWO2_12_FULL_64_99]
MKKTLIALAALSATAGAFAQSSVTLYGILDASVGYVNKANTAGKSTVYMSDSALQSSYWGMRGSEDIGGGLKVNFNLQSDVRTDTGAGNADFFRREANVSLVSATYGELRLGRTMSPTIANAQGGVVTPGNSIGVSAAAATGTAADFFTKNAITYYSPVMSGVRATLQYSPGEVAGDSGAGHKMAASLVYTNAALRLGAAAQQVEGTDGETSRTWYNVNGQYTWGPFKLGAGWYKVDQGDTTDTTATNADVGRATASNGTATIPVPSSHGYNLSVGYQVNPQAIVSATYVHNNQDSSLLNLQARYALSKRTTTYAMLAMADNGTKGVNFTPYMFAVSGIADKKQSALVLGVIHAF